LKLRICVSVMERTVHRTLKVLEKLEQHDPDLIEIRLDLMKNPSPLAAIRQNTNRPIIATIRRRGDGGFFDGREATRAEILSHAAKTGFDYVDVELNSWKVGESVRRFESEGAKTIVSYHNSKTTPGTSILESILKREKRSGADICKIVTTARSPADNLRCLEFVNRQARNSKLVCFAMGRLGIPSRVLSPVFGAYFTFASSGFGKETATGQVPIEELKTLYGRF
jgi:3-dehydroquinate dehydratase type I